MKDRGSAHYKAAIATKTLEIQAKKLKTEIKAGKDVKAKTTQLKDIESKRDVAVKHAAAVGSKGSQVELEQAKKYWKKCNDVLDTVFQFHNLKSKQTEGEQALEALKAAAGKDIEAMQMQLRAAEAERAAIEEGSVNTKDASSAGMTEDDAATSKPANDESTEQTAAAAKVAEVKNKLEAARKNAAAATDKLMELQNERKKKRRELKISCLKNLVIVLRGEEDTAPNNLLIQQYAQQIADVADGFEKYKHLVYGVDATLKLPEAGDLDKAKAALDRCQKDLEDAKNLKEAQGFKVTPAWLKENYNKANGEFPHMLFWLPIPPCRCSTAHSTTGYGAEAGLDTGVLQQKKKELKEKRQAAKEREKEAKAAMAKSLQGAMAGKEGLGGAARDFPSSHVH